MRVLQQVGSLTELPVVKRLPGLALRFDADATLQLAMENRGGMYREHWFVADGLLLGAVSQANNVQGFQLNRALATILEGEPATGLEATSSPEREALLEGLAPPDPLPEPKPGWWFPFQRAARRLMAGEPQACLDRLGATEGSLHDSAPIARLTRWCVLAGQGVEAAEHWQAERGVLPPVEPEVAVHIARELAAMGLAEAALDFARHACPALEGAEREACEENAGAQGE